MNPKGAVFSKPGMNKILTASIVKSTVLITLSEDNERSINHW